ncbi:sensor histidine kinase [Streptococcus merionis]|uniref:histidine kinase n=1 Tax=Streptococcus merionis TaxID=400065 RepID=A0A239SLW9_9STRE|nr:sensor histidine kinase [Streptococcus merionis]SNU86421.1 histidine kinase [Streptococcus merionis]
MRPFIRAWFRSRLPWLVLLLLIFMSHFGFAFLFENLQAILTYQMSLLAVLALFFLGWDLVRDWRKYQLALRDQAVPSASSSPSERVLQTRLASVLEMQKADQVLARAKQEELLDYFTLWAHQIKTPLTASQLLVEELADKDSQQALEQELFKVGQYADMAMTYLRLESFHDDLVLAREDLHDLIREAVKKYAIFFIRQQIRLNLADFDKTIVTDCKWFLIILEQVLSNSVKYTRSGEIAIYVEGDDLVIADTGIGIQPGDLQRVFERGFSGFNGRVSQQSSGLGLYLSKIIADKLGHSLTLTSQIGEGTQVRIGLKQADLQLD